jgi:hypothetical protein
MPENDESRLAVAMVKMVADHMHCLEEAVRRLVPRMEAEGDNTPIRDAVQWLRRAGAEQQLCLTRARLAADFGWSGAAQAAAPVVKYAGLSEEQMKVVRELQKEKDQERTRQRETPYSAGRTRRRPGSCNICGVEGHWGKDNACRITDIQAKLRREMGQGGQAGGTNQLPVIAPMPIASPLTQPGTSAMAARQLAGLGGAAAAPVAGGSSKTGAGGAGASGN